MIGIRIIILTSERKPKKGSDPLAVLQLRFAKGEISRKNEKIKFSKDNGHLKFYGDSGLLLKNSNS
jgi:hypothetical protein